MQSATFIRRLLAYLIDATLLLLAQALVLFAVLLVFGLEIPDAHLLAIAELAGYSPEHSFRVGERHAANQMGHGFLRTHVGPP